MYNPGIVNQLYGLYTCFNKLPNDYDLYIRMRTDLYFFDTNFLNEIVECKSNLILPDKVWFSNLNYPYSNEFNDFFWIGDYAASKYIADTYENLTELFKPGICNEQLLASRLIHSPIKFTISQIKCEFNLDRRTRGIENHLEETRYFTRKRKNVDTGF